MNSEILIQHMEYNDNKEAWTDFFRINIGTLCTPYELGRGVFIQDLSNFSTLWEDKLENIHTVIRESISRLGIKHPKNKQRKDTLKRDDYGLFYRFVSNDTLLNNYYTSKTKLIKSDLHSKNLIERKLSEYLSKINQDEFDRQLKNFDSYLSNLTALYEDVWNKQKNKPESPPEMTHVRYYYNVGLYIRNNSIPIKFLKEYIERSIETTGGGGCVKKPDGSVGVSKMALGTLSQLKSLCKEMGVSEELTDTVTAKRKFRSPLKSGYHHSHIKPYSVYGEGETYPEPGLLNISRGANEVN